MMSEPFYKEIVIEIARIIEAAGIFSMVLGIILATIGYFSRLFRKERVESDYHAYRANIGRSILLSLELLVGADIIQTVAMETTMDNVLILGAIVIIRTILSTALQIEINGYLPWEEAKYKLANKV